MLTYRIIKITIILFISILYSVVNIYAQEFTTKAKQALLMDADTGTVLYSKNADTKIPPASLAKIMTAEVVFNQLKFGEITIEDEFFVSENAWRTGGAVSGSSTMFAEINSRIALSDLLRGMIVQSANDGAIAIAEGIRGTESSFSKLMNKRAKEIGLKNSNFVNSTGLPAEGQYVSIRDLAKLARHMITQYPEYYSIYSEPSFKWNKILQRNRNPLLNLKIGADGMKTGFTEASGYAIVGSATNNGQRLIAVLSGMKSKKERANEARKIMNWGFNAFQKVSLFENGEVLGKASVYGGYTPSVDIVAKQPIEIYLAKDNEKKLRARIVYDGPIVPPVSEGTKIGVFKVWVGDELSQEIDVYAAHSVKKGGLQRQAIDALKELLFGWL